MRNSSKTRKDNQLNNSNKSGKYNVVKWAILLDIIAGSSSELMTFKFACQTRKKSSLRYLHFPRNISPTMRINTLSVTRSCTTCACMSYVSSIHCIKRNSDNGVTKTLRRNYRQFLVAQCLPNSYLGVTHPPHKTSQILRLRFWKQMKDKNYEMSALEGVHTGVEAQMHDTMSIVHSVTSITLTLMPLFTAQQSSTVRYKGRARSSYWCS